MNSSGQNHQKIVLYDDHELEMGASHIIEIDSRDGEKMTISFLEIINSARKLVFSEENLPRISISIFLSILSTGLNFLSPALLAESINLLASDNKEVVFANLRFSSLSMVSALVVSYGLAQVIPSVCNQIITPVSANNEKKIIHDSAKHLLEKSLHYHVNTLPADQFYFIQKGFTLGMIGAPLLTQIFPIIIQIITAGTLLSTQYGVELGLSLLILLVIYIGYSAVTAKLVIRENNALLVSYNETYEYLMATIERYKIIHDYGKVDVTIQKLNGILEQSLNDIFVRAINITFKISYGHSFISYAHMLFAALYVARGVKSGQYTVKDFIVVVGYLLELVNLMPAFGAAINQVFAAYPDVEFVFTELLNQSDKADNQPSDRIQQEMNLTSPPSVEFSNITYCHQPRPDEQEPAVLFQHLSFTISCNQLVAIVSESGVGKTTLFHLLARHYPIAKGNGVIKINDQDITKISLQSLRRNIAIFYRDPQLFKGSLRDNIAFGAESSEVTDEMIENTARQANLYDFIASFPQQLDTIIGPGGATLSDGQQQKVAVLRGFMKKSRLWLLDEITSSLDSESATQLLNAIRVVSKDVTILMITHKLYEVAQYANQVVVINKQGCVEQGTHEELLASSTLYGSLWQKATNTSLLGRVTASSKNQCQQIPDDLIGSVIQDFTV